MLSHIVHLFSLFPYLVPLSTDSARGYGTLQLAHNIYPVRAPLAVVPGGGQPELRLYFTAPGNGAGCLGLASALRA
jgi:hypothetical protein